MKKGIAIVILLLIAIGVGTWYFFLRPIATPSSLPAEQPTPVPTKPIETAEWKDQSEFRFTYPKTLSLNPHDEDTVNYAHVELTSSEHPGYIIVWAKDTTAQTIDAWATKEKLSSAIDTTLAGLPAKKAKKNEESDALLISAIRNGYLYQIEIMPTDADFWNGIFDQVSASFSFTSPKDETTDQPPAAQAPQSGGGDVEEETIE